MEGGRLDRLARTIAYRPSRRGLLVRQGLAALGISVPAGARKKRKHRKNAFGWRHV
jgi:hypothetical protein